MSSVAWVGLQKIAPEALAVRFKGQPAPATATTIAMVATDATAHQG